MNDLATLVWLAQIAALEIHVPQWRFGPHGNAAEPRPARARPRPRARARAWPSAPRWPAGAATILQGMGLDPVPVTSGSKGIHLYAALDGHADLATRSPTFAHELARALEADHPDLVVSDMKKRCATGKVLIDWSQNNGAKTTIAPYSLRGRHAHGRRPADPGGSSVPRPSGTSTTKP